MKPRDKTFMGLRFLVATASFVVLVAGLQAARTILVPFCFALFLAIVGGAAVRWLESKRMPNLLAVTLVVVFVMAALVGLAVLFGSSANSFAKTIPTYRSHFDRIFVSFKSWLAQRGIELTSSDMLAPLDPGAMLELLGSTIRGLAAALSKALLMIFIMLFLLLEATEFRQKLRIAFGESLDMDRFESVAYDVQRYLAIKTVTSAITGILVGFWVAMLGLDFAILWGVLAFLLNYIPVIGSIIASIPAVLLSMVDFGLSWTLLLGFGYIVINNAISNFLEPVLMGRRLGLSPLVVFMSLVFWGYVWGPAGMLLSVPLTMLVKIFLEHSEDFSWIAVLMGRKPVRGHLVRADSTHSQ